VMKAGLILWRLWQNRGAPGAHHPDLVGADVDADDVVPFLREARRRYTPDVPEPENADGLAHARPATAGRAFDSLSFMVLFDWVVVRVVLAECPARSARAGADEDLARDSTSS